MYKLIQVFGLSIIMCLELSGISLGQREYLDENHNGVGVSYGHVTGLSRKEGNNNTARIIGIGASGSARVDLHVTFLINESRDYRTALFGLRFHTTPRPSEKSLGVAVGFSASSRLDMFALNLGIYNRDYRRRSPKALFVPFASVSVASISNGRVLVRDVRVSAILGIGYGLVMRDNTRLILETALLAQQGEPFLIGFSVGLLFSGEVYTGNRASKGSEMDW